MARQCAMCEKGKMRGWNRKLLRGHYNRTSKRFFKPNLQKTTFEGRKVLACAKCIKTETRNTVKATPSLASDKVTPKS